ncbi:MAG: restriction endonuclease subunit S [Patescibacteria group bacterium]|jgi:type I restriction enzyme S subunit|nr:restriction endonuclease subunit S [Patescibacteria group bacterium]
MTQTNNVPRLRFPGFSEDWGIKKLSDITRRISDGIHTTPKYDDRGVYYFINGNNFVANRVNISESTRTVSREEYIKYKKDLDENTILMSINGTIGSLARYNNEPVILGKSACYINICDEINREYIYNFLKTYRVKTYFNSELSGSTIKNLSIKTIKNTSVPVPDISEQKKIADFLTAIDDKITIIDKNIELLKKYKKSITQKLFMHQLRFKNENGSNYPSWENNKLGEISSIKKGVQLNKENMVKDGRYPVLNGGKGYSGYTNKFNTTARTITISEGGNSCGYVSFVNEDFWSGGHLYTINTKINKNYVYHYLKFKQNLIMELRVGSGLPNIQKKDLEKLRVNIPSTHEQRKIANFLTSIDHKIELKINELELTKKLKKALLQQLFI